MRGRKSSIYPKIARPTTMEKMMTPDPTDPTRLDQPTDRPTFTYMYMYTYVYIHICIEICIYIFFMCRAGYPVSRPGKAKRESCKKKAHNDGHVPHKRKRNYPAQKVVQQMVEQLVVLHGVGAGVSSVRATATPGTHTRPGLYTPCVSILAPATPTEVVLWAKPLLFGAPPPQPQITHHACCPAAQIRRAHTWSASCACDGE